MLRAIRRWLLSVFLVPVLCLPQAASQTRADNFLAAQQEGVAKNPNGLTFTIRLKDNQDKFQQGEIIRVELAFSSSLPKTYELDGATYDRNDRLEIDSYHVDPADGAVDPLKDKVRAWLGGVSLTPILDEKPYLIVRELNEYLRFDRPGKYRLYVSSNRVQRATSNIIEFTIVPTDPEWARKQLQSAQAVLDSKDRWDEGIEAAARIVRFLGTTETVPYMVRHFDEDQGNFSFGLIGSPFRAAVIREMEAGLEAPDSAVSTWYLQELTMCSYAEKYAYRVGPYPGLEDKAKLELWQHEAAKEQLARRSVREEYVNRLAAAVLKKEGRAKAVSLNTLLSEISNWPKESRPSLTAEFVERLPSELAGVFFDLPVMTQQSLLQYPWDWIKGPEMKPVLERYYQNPSRDRDWSDPTAAGIALQRIYEMDAARGRELILKEIANPTGRVRFEVLALLPDSTLPELDEAFASALEKRRNSGIEQFRVQAQLLARYATPAVLPRVKSAWTEQNSAWSCEIRAPVIAYFLRADPAFGAQVLEQTLSPAARTHGACYDELGSVAQLYACPELEAAAIRQLDDPEPAAVLDAVATLGKYGSSAAEAPLWKRYEKWHDEWKDRAEELQTRRIGPHPDLEMPWRMESAFPSALGTARGWLADGEKLKRIQALCLTEMEREQMGYLISAAEAPKKRLSFIPSMVSGWTIEVAQYRDLSPLDAVKAKLAQFPEGTVFLWSPFNAGQDEEQKKTVFGELRAFLAAHGMSLEEPTSK